MALATVLFGQASFIVYRLSRMEKKLDRLTTTFAVHHHSEVRGQCQPPVAQPLQNLSHIDGSG